MASMHMPDIIMQLLQSLLATTYTYTCTYTEICVHMRHLIISNVDRRLGN